MEAIVARLNVLLAKIYLEHHAGRQSQSGFQGTRLGEPLWSRFSRHA